MVMLELVLIVVLDLLFQHPTRPASTIAPAPTATNNARVSTVLPYEAFPVRCNPRHV
jgi:hypothetical protein